MCKQTLIISGESDDCSLAFKKVCQFIKNSVPVSYTYIGNEKTIKAIFSTVKYISEREWSAYGQLFDFWQSYQGN